MRINVTFFLLILNTLLCAQNKDDTTAYFKDIEAITAAVQKTGQMFNEKNPEGILSFYAKDILVSYPNSPDMNYVAFKEAFAGIKNVEGSTKMELVEILVSGDMAMVRVNWHTTIILRNENRKRFRVAKDMQIWLRQKDGTWKFSRGHWFHENSIYEPL